MANRSTALLGHFWKLLNSREDRDHTDGLLLERFVVLKGANSDWLVYNLNLLQIVQGRRLS